MVSRTVSPGVKPHMGPKTRFLLLSDICGSVDVGAPSLARGRICHFLCHSQQDMASIFTSLLGGILHTHLAEVRFLLDTYYLRLYI
jgi:hypothetical protein